MAQHIRIRSAPVEAATLVQRALVTLLPRDRGYLAAVTDPAAAAAHGPRVAQSGPAAPDCYPPPRPDADAAVVEVWHANFRGERVLVASAAVSAAQPGWSKLSWDDQHLRTEMKPEWWKLLQLLPNLAAVEGLELVAPRGDDWPRYLPPERLDQLTVFAGLEDLDAATGRLLQDSFKPGVVRFTRRADPAGGGDFVRYRLHGDMDQGGDFGEIWLAASGPTHTLMTFCTLAMPLGPLPAELNALVALPAAQKGPAEAALVRDLIAESYLRLKIKVTYLQYVYDRLLAGLPPAWLDPLNPPATGPGPARELSAAGAVTQVTRLRAERALQIYREALARGDEPTLVTIAARMNERYRLAGRDAVDEENIRYALNRMRRLEGEARWPRLGPDARRLTR